MELLVAGACVAGLVMAVSRRPATGRPAPLGRNTGASRSSSWQARLQAVAISPEDGDDLPCPWCRAQTREDDTSCPSCGQPFG